jgi:hypothetical protein
MTPQMLPDIFPAIQVLCFLSNRVGLAPFACVREENPTGRKRRKFAPSLYGRFHTIFVIMFTTFWTAVMAGWRILYSYPRVRTVTILITDLTVLLVTYSVAVVSLAKCVRGRLHAFTCMMSTTPHADEGLSYPPQYVWENTNILHVTEFLYFVLYEVLFYRFQYTVWVDEHGSKNWHHIPISCVIHAVICIMEMQYFNLVIILKRRISLLNSRIDSVAISCRITGRIHDSGIIYWTPAANNMIRERQIKINVANETGDAVFAKICSTKECQQQLYKLRCVNDELSDAVSSVNSTYGLQILLSMTSTFISATTSLHFGIRFAIKLQEEPLILALIWAAVGIFRTALIISSCNAASVEGARTSVLLQKLLLEP